MNKEDSPVIFNSIAHQYELLNLVISGGLSTWWDYRVIKKLSEFVKPGPEGGMVVDLGCGTGRLVRKLKFYGFHALGVDPSLLPERGQRLHGKGPYVRGEAERLPLNSGIADAVVSLYTFRNWKNPLLGLGEVARILRPGGVWILIEFFTPHTFLGRLFLNSYMKYLIPLVGSVFGAKRAYNYLWESISGFGTTSYFEPRFKEHFDILDRKTLAGGVPVLYVLKRA